MRFSVSELPAMAASAATKGRATTPSPVQASGVIVAKANGEGEDQPGDGSLDLRVWIRLLGCAKIIEKRLRRNFQEHFDTTLPRFDVMAALYRVPEGLNMGALSRALLVSNGNVTAIVRQLHDSGMLASCPDPDDGRSAIVSLTSAGRNQFETLAAAHRGWVREALAEFPVEAQRQLVQLLTQLKTTIE